jgi:hypothetical protein
VETRGEIGALSAKYWENISGSCVFVVIPSSILVFR